MDRTQLQRTMPMCTVQCWYQSYWAAIKPQYRLQLVNTTTIPFICQSAILTTILDGPTRMLLCCWHSSQFLKVSVSQYCHFYPTDRCTANHENEDTAEFRKFRRQLFHSTLAYILLSLRSGMLKPEVRRCPDGHFRRALYALTAYIADYPEQVLLSCIVQGWCPL